MTDRLAPVSHPIHALMQARWSPRSFTDAAVTDADLHSLLEAGRWAASCFNEQPWGFIVARRSTDAAAHAKLAGLLVPNNAGWAPRADLLVITVARMDFTLTAAQAGKPNSFALYDLGQAMAQISLQAVALGLAAHQMRGFDAERAGVELGLPEGHVAATAVAIGHAGPADALPEALAAREVAPRTRLPLEKIAFGGAWGVPLA